MSMSDLPRDMLEEILSRVPINSIRAVQSTCKNWNTLFNDQSFTKNLFGKTIATKERESLVVMMMDYKVYLMSVNLHGIHKDDDDDNNVKSSIMHKAKLVSLNDDADDLINHIDRIFHCNGLLLLICFTKHIIKLAVMNPYFGQTRWIKPRNTYHYCDTFVIGYEKKMNKSLRTHKILRFNDGYIENDQIYEFEIYNFNFDSWKVFDFTPDWNIFFNHLGVSLKGNTYWFATDMYKKEPITDLPYFLICFDFTTERFGPRLPLPFHSYDDGDDTVTLSSVRDEQLAVLFHCEDTWRMEIWVTTKINPKEVSWNKLFLHIHYPFTDWAGSFFIDEKTNVAVVLCKFHPWLPVRSNIAHIVGKDGYFKEVDLGEHTHNKHCYYPLVCAYVPSSVQIKQDAPVMQYHPNVLVSNDDVIIEQDAPVMQHHPKVLVPNDDGIIEELPMVLTVLGPLAGRSFAITGKPNLLLLQPTNLPLLRLSLPLSLPQFSSSSSSCRLRSPIVFAAQESNLSVSNENETSEWLMQDFYTLRKDVEIASARVEEIRASAGLEQLEQEIANLESKATDTSFWDDRTKAQETLSALNDRKDRMRLLSEFKTMVEDAETIVKLTEEMDSTDVSLLEEAMGIIKELNKSLDRFELTQLLSGPYDKEGAVVYITAGAGGTDAQDWADMLLRMYMRWGEKQRYKTKVVEMSNGEEAGIKSATLEIEGRYAYGYISGEKGTHRIVRQSPFNSKGLRQTSFSGVEVMPLLPEEAVGIEIPEEDLDISFTRAGGKGGQNVNKVETAVRITHIPTGVAVRCTEERSQLANKTRALIRLKAKLLVIAEEQRATEIKEIRGDAVKAEWGQQIRNYVFHPYKLVKDVRTGHETSDITSVMDGDLDPFIKAYLKHKYTLAMASAVTN
ncbi:F-box associated domain type 1 [Arabidopsis thaliana x Arabidopsis arenosa]|uniref:F-box associated domain type 1 n=1 Tax=Arabidopsis thaliana x Arabidopsis arenosa TaxID=1240361 RepID=A0A8T1Y8M9_9BRAS|nr:F-box associated domain type 1 [Arabidopsis thaliana x Arabidopsis arenosa]